LAKKARGKNKIFLYFATFFHYLVFKIQNQFHAATKVAYYGNRRRDERWLAAIHVTTLAILVTLTYSVMTFGYGSSLSH